MDINSSMMGLYRDQPLKDFIPESGICEECNYGANQITGWRTNQEDRFICIPDFFKGFSYFGVYDGHGGEFVSEYLFRQLHKHVFNTLKENENDVELALFLAFLNADFNLWHINKEKYNSIMDAIKKEFSIKDLESAEDSTSVSKTFSQTSDKSQVKKNFRAAIASEVRQFLLENHVVLESTNDENEVEQNSSASTFHEDGGKTFDEDGGKTFDEKEDVKKSSDSNVVEVDKVALSSIKENIEESSESPKLIGSSSESPEEGWPHIGLACGSTATVVLINKEKIYAAYVGDSRCVAAIKGEAVEISFDHKPTIKEEKTRIKNAGFRVTKEGRINGGLNMSRAFGDFSLKTVNEPSSAVTCEPHMTVLNKSNDVDFIVIASDGIWNAMSSQDVVNFIYEGRDVELSEICAELFENILKKEDGDLSGHDNMSIIIIKNNSLNSAAFNATSSNESFHKENLNLNFLMENLNSSFQENIHQNEEINHIYLCKKQLNGLIIQSMGYMAQMKTLLPHLQLFIQQYDNMLQNMCPELYNGYMQTCSAMQNPLLMQNNSACVESVDLATPSESAYMYPSTSFETSPASKQKKNKFEVIDLCSDEESGLVEPIENNHSSHSKRALNNGDCKEVDAKKKKAKKSEEECLLEETTKSDDLHDEEDKELN